MEESSQLSFLSQIIELQERLVVLMKQKKKVKLADKKAPSKSEQIVNHTDLPHLDCVIEESDEELCTPLLP